jgi:flagellar hook-length control protein FliK
MTGVSPPSQTAHPVAAKGGKAQPRPIGQALLMQDVRAASEVRSVAAGAAFGPPDAAGGFGDALAAVANPGAAALAANAARRDSTDDASATTPESVQGAAAEHGAPPAPSLAVFLWSATPAVVKTARSGGDTATAAPLVARQETAAALPELERARSREGTARIGPGDASAPARDHAAAPAKAGAGQGPTLPQATPWDGALPRLPDGRVAAPAPGFIEVSAPDAQSIAVPQSFTVAEARHSSDGRITRLSLALRPEGLGEVTVTLRHAAGRLELDIRAERADVAEGLNADPSALLDAIADLEVRVATTDGGHMTQLPHRGDGRAPDAQGGHQPGGSRRQDRSGAIAFEETAVPGTGVGSGTATSARIFL